MEKLMVTNCAADTQMYPGVPKRFDDSETLAESVGAGWRERACIAHFYFVTLSRSKYEHGNA